MSSVNEADDRHIYVVLILRHDKCGGVINATLLYSGRCQLQDCCCCRCCCCCVCVCVAANISKLQSLPVRRYEDGGKEPKKCVLQPKALSEAQMD